MNLHVYSKVILTLQDLTRIVLTHSDNRQRRAPSHQVKNEIAREETVALFKLQTISAATAVKALSSVRTKHIPLYSDNKLRVPAVLYLETIAMQYL